MVPDSAGPTFDPTLRFLDPGQRSAITLTNLLDARRLLIDKQAGRAEAKRRQLMIIGTLGVLAEAHRSGLLDFEEALEQLIGTNFYLSTRLVNTVRHGLLLSKREPELR